MTLRAIRAAITAGCAYFLIVFAAGFALGTMRIFFLAPKFGETSSVLFELPIMLLISWFACQWIVSRWQLSPGIGIRLVMGSSAFAILMVAEVSVSTFGLGRTFQQNIGSYGQLHNQLGLAGQIMFALFPVVQRR
jgi:hypothetical protein